MVVEGLRILLKGGTAVADLSTAFDITRSRPHGHVAAVLGTLRKLRLDRTLAATASPERERAIALIVARILAPGSKLATARGLAADTARDSLAEMLGIESVDEDELYAAMDWLLERQGTIEKRLAKRHLSDGALVLYDLTSTYFEGRCCPLAKRGYSRDGRRDKLQIVFGLLCNREGCPVAVEVFDGNTADPSTVGVHIVEKDRSLQAMATNSDEQHWIAPLLRLRDFLDPTDDHHLRGFRRRLRGHVQIYDTTRLDAHGEHIQLERPIPGPYLQAHRDRLLEELLKAQRWIREHDPHHVRNSAGLIHALPANQTFFPAHRLIPARAGNTDASNASLRDSRTHPRTGGEQLSRHAEEGGHRDSSPHLRGTLFHQLTVTTHDFSSLLSYPKKPSSRTPSTKPQGYSVVR